MFTSKAWTKKLPPPFRAWQKINPLLVPPPQLQPHNLSHPTNIKRPLPYEYEYIGGVPLILQRA